jgi:predicted transcriptional regulator
VIEAIEAHLDALNKLQFSKDTEIPRSTLYYFSKTRNPTLKTLARVVHELSEYNLENECPQVTKKTGQQRLHC